MKFSAKNACNDAGVLGHTVRQPRSQGSDVRAMSEAVARIVIVKHRVGGHSAGSGGTWG